MIERLRALLVEDTPSDAKLILHALRAAARSVESERVEDATAMRAALEGRAWDVVISDWSLPGFDAMGALDLLKSTGQDIPFIIVSGTVGEDTAADAMRAGARDYVLKERLTRLAPAVEREMRERDGRAERRRAADALRASEARFARLADSGIIGILTVDLAGQVHDANDACLRMLGYSRADLVAGAINWVRSTPVEWRPATELAVEQVRTQGIAPAFEKELLRKDGTRLPVLVGSAALDLPRCISFMTDLTDQKKAERALERSEEQLRQHQRLDAIGSLAGGVAHDFNNLLAVVLGYTGMLITDLPPDDPVRADLEEIRSAGERAADLTRQLLLFSRQQPRTQKVLDPRLALDGLAKMLRRIVGEDVELAMAASSTGKVLVDPAHIEQVIMNLVVNARDAMPAGGKLTVEISDAEIDEAFAHEHLGAKPGRYVMLAVSDTGVGMDEATQARVFEPFFTTKAPGRGTGLGLSTVFGIVRQSGGTIWVSSEVGRGSTFRVYLPQTDAVGEAVVAPSVQASLRGSETILLVEDDDQVRAVIRGILKRHGYQVVEASNAAGAMVRAGDLGLTIDLLLTDVVMPQVSGPDLAKRLSGARPLMRILCMSGYTDETIFRHGILGQGLGFLEKPFTPATLLDKVREVLDAPPPSRSAR